MNLKLIKILDVIFIFCLCLVTHFVYTWVPNTLFSIFFPVNESIWEHLKMIYSAIIVWGFFDFCILKLFKIKFKNFLVNLFISSFFSLITFLLIYMPLFYFFGNSVFLNIVVLIIAIIVSQIISYYVLKAEDYNYLNYISLIGIIFIYIIFGVLTYYPFKNDLFYDFKYHKYGINTYDI